MSKVHLPQEKGIHEMRASHAAAGMSVAFDDPDLVSCAGLAPVVALASGGGLHRLVAERPTVLTANGHL